MKRKSKNSFGLFMFTPLTSAAGAGKYFINLANDFSSRCERVCVVTLNRNFFKRISRLISIYHRLDFKGRNSGIEFESESAVRSNLGNAQWQMTTFNNLEDKLQEHDVLYVQNELVDLLILKYIGYRNLPPVIVGVHTPLYYPIVNTFQDKLHNFLYTGPFYKWLLNEAALVHVSNKYTYDLVVEKFKIPCVFEYYPFSVDTIVERSKEVKSKISFDKSKKNLAFIARFTEQKGISTLVEIVDEIATRNTLSSKVVINIFGKGPLEKLIEEIDKKYDFVKYHGYAPNEEIPHILSQQQVFICTSGWETLPFTVLEAQAMGVPVVSLDIPGPSDIVIDKETGFLVKDKKEYVKKLTILVKGKNNFNSKKIQDFVRERFSPEKVYSKLLSEFLNAAN